MKVTYKCTKCNAFFIKPLINNGMFACPICKKPEFETIKFKKYMRDYPLNASIQ